MTADRSDWLTARFEEDRAHLRGVAYKMLGSLTEADDAVQEAWLRLSRADASGIENLRAWLTTVVARVCLNMLQARRSRREEPLETHFPDPIVSFDDVLDPEHETLLADSVGLALLVVLETLTPAERLAFVLHDMFGVPFEEIATIVERSPTAARQLASRARRRVRESVPAPDVDLERQREVVEAFIAASRDGDFDALLAVLDPDVVLRAHQRFAPRGVTVELRGAREVASRAIEFRRLAPGARHAIVNGTAGAVAVQNGRPISVVGFVIRGRKIVEMDILADPERLARLGLSPTVD